MAAWSGDDLAGWFATTSIPRASSRWRARAASRPARLDGVVADDMKAVLPDAADVKAKRRADEAAIAAREQLPTLVVPPSVPEMEASLHADVRAAAYAAAAKGFGIAPSLAMVRSIRVGANQVRAARGGGIRSARALRSA